MAKTRRINVEALRRGAAITAEWHRARSAERQAAYNANPKLCQHCSAPLLCDGSKYLSELKRQQFCSHSCSLKHQLIHSPLRNNRKRKLIVCEVCGGEFPGPKRRTCPECWAILRNKLSMTSLAELTHPEIRGHARNRMKPAGKACVRCGYAKFVEVCHVQPVESFPDYATLEVVNHLDNLILLCPNCHWEFDHGMAPELRS